MNIIQFVNETLSKKHTLAELREFIAFNDIPLKELEVAFSNVVRCRKMTSTVQQAFCFWELCLLFRIKSQVPTYPDPKTGNVPKKIHDIGEFIEYNRNSVFGFITELEKLCVKE